MQIDDILHQRYSICKCLHTEEIIELGNCVDIQGESAQSLAIAISIYLAENLEIPIMPHPLCVIYQWRLVELDSQISTERINHQAIAINLSQDLSQNISQDLSQRLYQLSQSYNLAPKVQAFLQLESDYYLVRDYQEHYQYLIEFKDLLQDYLSSSSESAKSIAISELSTVKALKSLHSSANDNSWQTNSWQTIFISTLSKISINRRQMLTHSGAAIAGFAIALLFANSKPKPQPLTIVTSAPIPEPPLDPIQNKDKAFRDNFGNGIYMEMVQISSGRFKLGSPMTELERRDHESPMIEVNVPTFYMAKFVVTQEQWVAVMGSNPAIFREDLQAPIENISWLEAKEFCQKLSSKSTYKYTYRLPSEAEWEYACRAGTSTAYHFGDRADQLPDYAWFKGNANQRSQPIGKKIPNPWGLHEMHGGIWEWCEDVWHDSYRGAPADGSAWLDGGGYGRRVRRGGSWSNEAKLCRSASRDWHWQGDRYNDIGVRVVI